MSTLSRFLRSTRPHVTLRTSRTPTNCRKGMAGYFPPSNSRISSSNHFGLARSRFYHSWNPHFDPSSNLSVLYSLMGVNIAIFGYGLYVKETAKAGFPQAWSQFYSNMTLNLTDVRNGAWWTMITSTFAHISFGHIAGNMFTTYFLGKFLCQAPIITPLRLLTIALGSGLSGSVGYLYSRYQTVGNHGIDNKHGLGFSGALMGITSVAACLYPTSKVLIYGIVPMPLWALVAGYAFYDGYYLNDPNSRVAHSGHLGGLAFGITYYMLRLRGLRF
ncbi:hypothetical protein GQ44DRAFT_704679 [Phaeosphaeriaceae sp. PMI808]|nr:hypothetical protein GQ44DRAFT_704679 [Phaeosphaeriaceae sp. PMI808]